MFFTYTIPKGDNMWEITLVGKPSDIGYFLDLKDILKSKFNKEIIVVISFEKDLICSIASTNQKNTNILKHIIYETIIKVAKSEYYQNNLELFTSDKSLNSFILSSLILINLDDEINYANHYAKLGNTVYVKSFVNFKLNNMVKMWRREIDYYNVIFGGIHKEEFYLEFLRFLAHNLNEKFDIMYLEETFDNMLILDNKGKKVRTISKNDEIGVIVQLIMLAPKKIIINCINSLSSKVSTLINYIFEDKVSILL